MDIFRTGVKIKSPQGMVLKAFLDAFAWFSLIDSIHGIC